VKTDGQCCCKRTYELRERPTNNSECQSSEGTVLQQSEIAKFQTEAASFQVVLVLLTLVAVQSGNVGLAATCSSRDVALQIHGAGRVALAC